MARRQYSSTAQRTTLSGSITDVATTVPVTAVTGWPGTTPYTIIVDPDTVNEEIMSVTARAGLNLTVTRAVGGTTGVAHSSGAVVQHGVYAADFDEANLHVNSSTSVHGVTGAVVGTTDTQTLAGKTLTTPTIASMANANHNHSAGAGGGLIPESSVTNLVSDLAAKVAYPAGGADGNALIKSGTTAAWGSAGGLVFITSATASSAATLSVNNCFTTTFHNYRIIYTLSAVSGTNILVTMRLRASSTDNTTTSYSSMRLRQSGATLTGVTNPTANTAWDVANATTTYPDTSFVMDIAGPQLARLTHAQSREVWVHSDTTITNDVFGNSFAATTQFDGFSLIASSGTMSGIVRVYGYQNA